MLSRAGAFTAPAALAEPSRIRHPFRSMTLAHYCSLFSGLTRAPGPMWDATTRNRAPHKPLLLLAVMDLVARGVITSRVVSITGELVELNELFTDHWRSIVVR